MNSEFIVQYIRGEHGTRRYFDEFVKDGVLALALADCPHLYERCLGSLWDAFSDLDAVPRTQPLWFNSNMRVTFTKVKTHEIARAVPLAENPADSWRLLAVGLCAGDLTLCSRAADALLISGQLTARDIVTVFFNLIAVSGDETSEALADLARRHGLTDASDGALKAQEGRGSREFDKWAVCVRRQLSEPAA
jgi:hypothetical protein